MGEWTTDTAKVSALLVFASLGLLAVLRKGFGGISAAGALWVALEVAKTVENATIVFVVCDRGDRYLSTGVFNT